MNAVVAGYVELGQRTARRIGRIVSRLPIEMEARRLLGVLGRPRGAQLRVPDDEGWVRFDTLTLPGAGDVFVRLQALGEQWVREERHTGQANLPYKLTRKGDLAAHPEIPDLALLLRAAASYLGPVPRLYAVDLWWSPNQTLKGSQLYHCDHRDSRQAKIFINLNDVTAESGPLHSLSGKQAARFNRKVGYSQQRILDEQVYSVVRPEEVMTTAGPAGSGFLVDTGRCLHYGSRGNRFGRLVFMAVYIRANCVDPGKGQPVLDELREEIARTRYADDPVRHFAMTALL